MGKETSVENENILPERSVTGIGNEKSFEITECLENVLMRFCRESKKYTSKEVATHLGIGVEKYRKMEKGDLLLTYQEAARLGCLYEVSGSWFYKEAIQLDLLLSRMAIIKILKNKNDVMIEKLKERRGPE